MKETWDALRQKKQEQRAENRVSGRQAILDAGYNVEFRNFGTNLIVEKRVDFWPGTGRWIERETKRRGFGAESLIEWLRNRAEGY